TPLEELLRVFRINDSQSAPSLGSFFFLQAMELFPLHVYHLLEWSL
ncbi:hypothetical protein Tco_1117378, partial [Tanacetum coccineum]